MNVGMLATKNEDVIEEQENLLLGIEHGFICPDKIDPRYLDADFCDKMVKIHPKNIQYVPDHVCTLGLCLSIFLVWWCGCIPSYKTIYRVFANYKYFYYFPKRFRVQLKRTYKFIFWGAIVATLLFALIVAIGTYEIAER